MDETLSKKEQEYNESNQAELNPFMTENKSECGLDAPRKFTSYKLTKQAILVGIWTANGLMMSMFGPSMPDLTMILGLNYEEIARALFGAGIGSLTGAIIGGIVCERFYKRTDMFMAFSYFTGSIAFGLVLWMPGLVFLFCMACFIGFALGFVNAGGNTMVMHLWDKKSGPPMYSLHFGYALGGVIGPQIVKPFLTSQDSHRSSNSINSTTSSATNITFISDRYNFSFISNNTETNSHIPDVNISDSHLFIPFCIAAGINLIFAVSLFILSLMGEPKGYPKRKNASSTKELCSPQSCATGHPIYGTLILLLLFLYYFMSVGTEVAYERYIFAFATESGVGFNTSQAATLTSLFWFCHMGGRAFGIVISKFFPISLIILVDLILLMIVSVCLVFTAHEIPTALWVLTACFGFLCSPLFPAGMLWSNNVLKVNSMSVMICLLGASMGASGYNYIIGYTYEYYGPRTFMYIEACACVLFLLIFGLMELIAKMLKKTKDLKKNQLSVVEFCD